MDAGELTRVAVVGPLAPFESGFRAQLERTGYTPRSADDRVHSMARLSCWLQDRGLDPEALTPPVVTGLRREFAGLGPVVAFLREAGAMPGADSIVDATPAETLLAEFRDWLVSERGLASDSVRCYVVQARPFVASLPEPLDAALAGLDAGHVTSFMLAHCRARNPGSAKAAVTAIRALLRFLHVAGHVPVSLVGAVPAVAGWRVASLPRGLDPDEVELLLASCDAETVVGRRDLAVLTVLARLGLRGAEVAALELGDIDWRGGELQVCGKGSRTERLPLPVPVGEALAAYVTGGRPRCEATTVFVTVRAPHRRLTPSAVRQIVASACRRTGGPRRGAHRLRHSLATGMLRAGAPLAEVGQVLRHRSALATATYAKVDAQTLSALARPWPGGGA